MRLIFLLFFLIPFSLISQEYNKMYYNSEWLGTSIDRAKFYRISKFNSQLCSFEDTVIDYYVKNDVIEMKGYYLNGKKQGNFKFYFPNKELKLNINYNDNERIGTWIEYNRNGTKHVELKYDQNGENIIALNDSLGNSIIDNGKFKYYINYSNNFNIFFPNTNTFNYQLLNDNYSDRILIKGEVINNKRNGKWKIFRDKKLYAKLVYDNGKFQKGYYIVNGNKIRIKKIEDNYNSFSLINPVKFQKTENFMLEPGAKIKSNYVLEGLVEYKYHKKNKITLSSNTELNQYIEDNFSLLSVSNLDNLIIEIRIKDGKPIDFKIEPMVSREIKKEFKLLLETIEKFDFHTSDTLKVKYQFK